MTTKYPNGIDDNISIPQAIDLITPVKAEVVNNLRGSIIAVQSELGIDPSREYGTVRARLDAITSLIGSGGGGGSVAVLDEGIILVNPATRINFIGPNVTVTDTGTCQADVEISCNIEVIQETILVTNGNVNNFTLSRIPSNADAVQMYINGQKLQYGTTYVVSGNVATYIGTDFIIQLTDDVEFYYIVTGGLGYQESVDVESIGETNFSLSRTPMNGSVVQMFINGQKQQYGVDYTVISSLVTYSGSLILGPSDDVEFWYISSATVCGGGGGAENLLFVNVGGGSEVFRDRLADTVSYRTLVGLNDIDVDENGNIIEINGYALLPLDGGRAMTGNLDMGGNDIINAGNISINDISYFHCEKFTPNPEQISFELEHEPINNCSVLMFVNKLKVELTTDYTISGNTVTYVGDLILNETDTIEFYYFYRDVLLGNTGGGESLSETLEIGNISDGYDIILSSGDMLTSTAELSIQSTTAMSLTAGSSLDIIGGTGGSVNITGGTGNINITQPEGNSQQIYITSGNTSSSGGSVSIGGGTGGSGYGGSVNLRAGNTATGTGGPVTLTAGNTTSATTHGAGNVTGTAGNYNNVTNTGARFVFEGGEPYNGGNALIYGGIGHSSSNYVAGGDIQLTAGNAINQIGYTAQGGSVSLTAGNAGANGNGGDISIASGNAGSSSGSGGDINVAALDGGNISIHSLSNESGSFGRIFISAGLSSDSSGLYIYENSNNVQLRAKDVGTLTLLTDSGESDGAADINIYSGGSSDSGGNINIICNQSGSNTDSGGDVFIKAGDCDSSDLPGNIFIASGNTQSLSYGQGSIYIGIADNSERTSGPSFISINPSNNDDHEHINSVNIVGGSILTDNDTATINIYSEHTFGNSGSILLTTGAGSTCGNISLNTGAGATCGNFSVTCGSGGTGGSASITTGSGNICGNFSVTCGSGNVGGTVDIKSGNGITPGNFLLTSGNGTVRGGEVDIKSGNASTGAGGDINVIAGSGINGTSTSLTRGGDINLTAGEGLDGSTDGYGGYVNIISGSSVASRSGNLFIKTGSSGDNSYSGSIYVETGIGGNNGSGNVYLRAAGYKGEYYNSGGANGFLSGGALNIAGGIQLASGDAHKKSTYCNGGDLQLYAGDGYAGTDQNAVAGNITIQGGGIVSDTTGNVGGGIVEIRGGNGYGSNGAGSISIYGGTGSGTNSNGGSITLDAGTGTGFGGNISLNSKENINLYTTNNTNGSISISGSSTVVISTVYTTTPDSGGIKIAAGGDLSLLPSETGHLILDNIQQVSDGYHLTYNPITGYVSYDKKYEEIINEIYDNGDGYQVVHSIEVPDGYELEYSYSVRVISNGERSTYRTSGIIRNDSITELLIDQEDEKITGTKWDIVTGVSGDYLQLAVTVDDSGTIYGKITLEFIELL